MSEHKYKLKYDLDTKVGEFTKEELEKDDAGGTDALILVSLLYPEDGSFSTYFTTYDGRNEGKNLEDIEIFKFWSMLSKRLSESNTLSVKKKEIASMAFEMVRVVILEGRNNG